MNSESYHLARRLSNRIEPDLLQENYTDDSHNGPTYSKEFCKALIDKMCADSALPNECNQYPKVISEMKRRNSDKSAHAVAFAGMSPKEQAAAMAAREKGHLNQAQITRRLTSSRRVFIK